MNDKSSASLKNVIDIVWVKILWEHNFKVIKIDYFCL